MKNLIEERNSLLKSMQNFLDEHEDKNGKLSAENEETYLRMESDYDALEDSIARKGRMEKREARLNQPTAKPLTDTPENSVNDYKNAFEAGLRTRFTKVSNALKEGSDVDGGYLVPDEWDARMIEAIEANNIMRGISDVITTHGGSHKIPVYATKDEAVLISELAAYTEMNEKFSEIELHAYKIGGIEKVSDELLEDNTYDLEARLTEQNGKKLGRGEEKLFLTGTGPSATGDSKPSGVFDATVGGNHLTQLTSAMTCDDILDLIYALRPVYRPKGKFIARTNIVKAMRKLKDNEGRYLWQPSLIAGQPSTFDGFEVLESEYAPNNKIAFGDFNHYIIGDRGSRKVQRLNELYAPNGAVGFLFSERVDGKLSLKEAVQVLPLQSAPANKKSK